MISLESSNFPKFNLAKGVSCVITAIIVIKKRRISGQRRNVRMLDYRCNNLEKKSKEKNWKRKI